MSPKHSIHFREHRFIQRRRASSVLNILCRLNAISMTMFAHNVCDSSDSVASLLEKIANGPHGPDTTLNRLAAIVIGAYPRLLNLPNPMKHWADMLQVELGRIAEDVWDAAERNEVVGGMDARVLEVLSTRFTLLYSFEFFVRLLMTGNTGKGQKHVSKDEAVAEVSTYMLIQISAPRQC